MKSEHSGLLYAKKTKNKQVVRFEVSTAVTMMIIIFWERLAAPSTPD
jgi:hypothetical protein